MPRFPAVAGAWLLVLLSGAVHAAAPAFTLNDTEGKPFRLEDHRGEVVLLNFWATYCVPCLTELEAYRRMQERLGPRGLRVVAVSVDQPQTAARVRSFAQSRAFPFPVVFDPEQDVYRLYNASALPTTVLIDRAGDIAYRREGFQPGDETELEARFAALTPPADSAPVPRSRLAGDTLRGTPEAPRAIPFVAGREVTLSGANFLRANYGKEDRDQPDVNGRLEDWFDLRLAGGGLSYQARFRAHQFLRDLPGTHENLVRDPTHRVVKQSFAYESDRADLRAGNFYGTLNRGLVLRMFEDRLARIDRDATGAWATLKLGDGADGTTERGAWGRGRASVFGGKTFQRFTDLYTLDADEENARNTWLQGAEAEWEPRAGLRVGAQALEAFREDWRVRLAAGNVEWLAGPSTVYLAYAGLSGRDAFNYPNAFHGRAVYGSLSATLGRLELGAEGKYYYNYDLGFAEPPSLLKYHTYRLMARALLFPNNQNERGGAARGAWRFGDEDAYTVNAVAIESHPERNPAFLVHGVALPYFDLDQELRFADASGKTLLLDLDWNTQRRFEAGTFEDLSALTAGVTASRPLGPRWSAQAEAEVQARRVEFRALDPGDAAAGRAGAVGAVTGSDSPWLGVVSATLGRTSAWTFTVDYEVTTSERDRDAGSMHDALPGISNGWASAYFTWSAFANHQINLWAGQRRERVVCSGGSCRVEPAFEGGELTWTAHF
jgi:peroxiredoxin